MLEGAGQEEWAIVGLTTESQGSQHTNIKIIPMISMTTKDGYNVHVMYTNMTEHYNKYRANANGHVTMPISLFPVR